MIQSGSHVARRALTLRRTAHHTPFQVSATALPANLVRRITVQSSSDTSKPPLDHPDPSTFQYLAPSSSRHPFASASQDQSSPNSADNASSSSSNDGVVSDDPGASEAGPSNASSSISVIANLPAPPVHDDTKRQRPFAQPFDSYAIVKYLQQSTLSPGTSTTLMEAMRALLIKRGDQSASDMLSKEDRENQAYLFRAALAELRTELSVRARNDSATLKAMSGALRREVDQLEQKLKEEMDGLKHDIELDMNNRKAETRAELKGFNLDIEEINNKFTISLGDLRTEIEASKWDQTRRSIAAIVVTLVAGVSLVLSGAFRTKEASSPKKKAAPAPEPPAPVEAPIMRDMGVGTSDEFLEDLDHTQVEQRLEQILHDSGVDKLDLPAKKKRDRSNSRSRPQVDVDRI